MLLSSIMDNISHENMGFQFIVAEDGGGGTSMAYLPLSGSPLR